MPWRAYIDRPRRRLDPVWIDGCIAAALLCEMEIQLALTRHVQHRPLEAAAAAVLAGTVAVRRRWPAGSLGVAVWLAALVSGLGGRLADHTVAPILAVVILFYGAGAFLSDRRAKVALFFGLAGFTTMILVTTPMVSGIVFEDGALGVAPWAIGRMLRVRAAGLLAQRELAESIDAEREQHELSVALGERTRIARELHDVIAHSVSVMVIQAGGARIVMDGDPDQAERSLQAVERAGREALAEMRRLLGVLDDGEDPRALAPQPGLADLPALISRTRAAGLGAELEIRGEVATISPGLDLTAYRIVQEALTNAVKHAGPARATVRVGWADDALELEVSDDGRGAEADHGMATGHGIPGMRERVALQGGSLDIGSRNGRGFRVRARLPITGRAD